MTTKPFIPAAPHNLEPTQNVGQDHIDKAIGWIAGDIPSKLWAEARARILDVLEDVREKATEPIVWTVYIVTNVSTGAARVAGHVTAIDHDAATEIACAQGLIRDFQTFRITQADCECYHSCGSCSHDGEWHTHEGEHCPVHPDAMMVG